MAEEFGNRRITIPSKGSMEYVRPPKFTELFDEFARNLDASAPRTMCALEINGFMGSGKTELGQQLCNEMQTRHGLLLVVSEASMFIHKPRV